jgi:hypothetical protein
VTLPLGAITHNQSPFWLGSFATGCKLVRGQPAEAGMRPAGIVIEPPRFDDPSRHRQAPEDMFVETLVAEATVEAFDEGVPDCFPGAM